ncbi:MAG: hypothetical protein O7D91_17530 [Planctomycetota bacterium]|nr:hypothetical protein [Planctomycetota bacterium]
MAIDVRAKHSHILSLELRLSGGDQLASSTGASTTTSSTFQDKVTKTFTPATAGDYLIVAMCQLEHASVSTRIECQLLVDGVVYSKMRHDPRVATEVLPWVSVLGAIDGETLGEFDATSHTVKIQFRSVGGVTTSTISNAHILILRLDTFKNFYYQESLGRATTTNAAYQTKLTNAPTLANSGNHLIFAGCHIDGTAGSGRFTAGQITAGGTQVVESLHFPTNSVGADDAALALYRMENLSSGASATNTWKIDIKKGGSGVGGVGVEHSAICVIELAEPVTEKTVFLGRLAGMSATVLAHTSQ